MATQLDKFNGKVPTVNWVNLGLHIIRIDVNSKARIYRAAGKSFTKNAQGQPTPMDMEVPEAFKKAKEWAKYIWEHNDKEYLVNEFGLTKEFIRGYLGYCGYGI